MGNRSWGRDQTKCSLKLSLEKKKKMVLSLPYPDTGYWAPLVKIGQRGWTTTSSWWPDSALRGGTPFLWAHHLQEGPKGSGAKCFGWQPKAGTLAVRSLAAETSSRDVENHVSDGEVAGGGAFNSHVGSDSETWTNCFLFFIFCKIMGSLL